MENTFMPEEGFMLCGSLPIHLPVQGVSRHLIQIMSLQKYLDFDHILLIFFTDSDIFH